VLRDKLTVFSPHSGVFYRKERKGFAEGATASRPLRSPCALCGKKHRYAVRTRNTTVKSQVIS
jgi:hypothetical protein